MRITITLSDNEYESLKNGSESNGRSISSEVRFRLFNKTQTILPTVKRGFPYATYRFLPNPHGEFKPYFSDFYESEVIILQNKKPPFDNVILKKGDEWFDYVLNQNNDK